MKKKNLIAQWAFDTRPILGRLHLYLEDVGIEWIKGGTDDELNDSISFVDHRTERMLAMTSAVTALGTRLFGRFGEGANPLLEFGRIYARPGVAKFLESCVIKLINDKSYSWDHFRHDIALKDIMVWGAAIDTLENNSRFAKGEAGPLTVLHLFDQPLAITDQYEGYIRTLILPKAVVDTAADDSILANYFTHRGKDEINYKWAGLKE